MKRRTFRVAIWCATSVLTSACIQDRLPPQNYRITLTVQENGRLFTASSVIQLRQTSDLTAFGFQDFTHTRGHAPFVMLPDGSMVAQTLGGWGGYYILPRGHIAFPRGYPGAAGEPPLHLKQNELPEVVYFATASDPASEVPLFNFKGWVKDDPEANDKIHFIDESFEETSDPPDLTIPDELSWMSDKLHSDVKAGPGLTMCSAEHCDLGVTGWDLFRGKIKGQE